MAEISIPELEIFVHANAASIVRFQEAMREVFELWDENRVRGDKPDIPLTLDIRRDKLKEKIHQLIIISEKDPVSARAIFKEDGFGDDLVPEDNGFDWEDTPTNKVLYPILKTLEESSSAQQAFGRFFRWSNGHIGLIHWMSLFPDQQTDPRWVAPKLFGGSIYKYRGIFIYDKGKRASDRKHIC
ncbi:uncharacterized protein DFL_003897 [Arthrobotrys flagrans]|uniref:Uncharacterized protein n=1 Tax=Arthrobotrys flagrans TaxID=97331 RepID=A0A437A346_ARTFL|nr:hypothetical protein DFL_003897 [Arthrobotrys flagrans]